MNEIEGTAKNPEWEKARKELEKLNQGAGGSKVKCKFIQNYFRFYI